MNDRELSDYRSFIGNKAFATNASGIPIEVDAINPMLYDFQRDIVRWSLMKGKAAIFADCGLGKTPMQLEWAKHVHRHTGRPVLILAPLAVASQTVQEGLKFGVDVKICDNFLDVENDICITNYEKLDNFIPDAFGGIVLDESSILKSYTGKVRSQIIDSFKQTPFRLACTATPAPNDFMELGNHSEFLGVMTRSEMLSMFFVHDGGETSKWRLKGHAEDVFWEWMCSWAVYVNSPEDIGYDIGGFRLPKMHLHEVIVDGDTYTHETLTLTQRRDARRSTLELRCQKAADMVNASDAQWLVWCDLNAESTMLHALIPDSVEVQGSDKNEHKTSAMMGFSNETVRCLVTKPSIAGFGMNWQNCHNMIFTGLSDSYEQFYQAVRRCWRFGQEHEVNVYIVISAKEGAVRENIERKQADFDKMKAAMAEFTSEITKKEIRRTCRITTEYIADKPLQLPDWREFDERA